MSERNSAPIYDVSGGNDQQVFTGEGNFERNCGYISQFMQGSADILLRRFTLSDGRSCAVVLVDGMCDKDSVEQSVVLAARRYSEESSENKFADADGLLQQFSSTEVSSETNLTKGYIAALTGDVLVIIENEPKVFVFGYRSIESRSVGESSNEGSISGPHEAFTENFRTNTGLLRRRISDPNFVIEHMKVGQRSHTSVALCYIRGLTDEALVERLRSRISRVDIDIINDSGQLAQLTEDRRSGLFPQTDLTELPDSAAAELCSGRAAVIVSGSPQVMIAPADISLLMHVSEDDYRPWSVSTVVRLLRWLALLISVTGTSLYVAMVAYHPGLLPTELLFISAINRLNVPFSALTEVLIIEFFLELLREASIRLPQAISTPLSVVGGLIVGDSAIQAGLVSPLLIIVAGLTAIAGFSLPSYNLAAGLRLIKYLILLLTSLLGLLGLICGVMIFVSLAVRSTSFGLDFTVPFAPMEKRGLLRSLAELPARLRTRRPPYLSPADSVRMRTEGGDE